MRADADVRVGQNHAFALNLDKAVLFDPQTVGSPGRPERRYDLPGAAKRMVMRSAGVEMTLVNGVPTWARGALTGAGAGVVLRASGR